MIRDSIHSCTSPNNIDTISYGLRVGSSVGSNVGESELLQQEVRKRMRYVMLDKKILIYEMWRIF